jgi:tetratricopeptide (TPR) repeat protein
LPVAPKGALWTESVRQSALAEALRGCGKHREAVSALSLAFQSEADPRQKRSLALRLSREAAKAKAPQLALGPLHDSRKGCDHSGACLETGVAEADLLWNTGKFAEADALYEEIAKSWPQSTEAPWALYQIGNAHSRLGRRNEASATWKSLVEKYPGSYWAAQARLRLEDAVWGSRYREGK